MGYPSVNRLTLIIPREAIPAPDAQLPTRIWLIIRGIVHMWNIDQFDLIAWLWCANGPATGGIVGPNTGTGTTVLGHPITTRGKKGGTRRSVSITRVGMGSRWIAGKARTLVKIITPDEVIIRSELETS